MPARPRGWMVAAALLLGGTPAARATLWESDHWGLTAGMEAGAGYDNNLFARAGGAGDSYLLFTPSVILRRLNSLTGLEADLSVRSYSFLNHRDLNTLDPALAVHYRFPSDDEEFATEEFAAQISRSTDGNTEVGDRLRQDDFGATWDARFNPTGNITVRPRAEFGRANYLTRGFNTNDDAAAGLTFALLPSERLELGAGYDFAYSRTQPDVAALPSTTGRHHRFTFRGRGEFLPKVTGEFSVGVSHDDYEGAFHRSDWDLVGAVNLAWQATPGGKLTVKADRTTYFSGSGAALVHSGAGFDWSQEVGEKLTATLGVDAAEVRYYFGTSYRRDRQRGGHFQLHYTFNERCSATLSATYYAQRSDTVFDVYDHSMISASLSTKL